MTRLIKAFFVITIFISFTGCKDNSSQYYLKNGSAKYKLEDYKNAVKDLTTAIELDKDLAEAYYLRALCKSNMGKYKESLDDFNKAIELEEDFTEAIFNRAFYAKEPLKDYEGAIKDYSQLIAMNLDVDNSYAYNNRGFDKYMILDYNDALQDVNRSIKINNTNSYAYKNRALIYLALDSLAYACEDLKKAQDLGFTQNYGAEVDELLEQYCN